MKKGKMVDRNGVDEWVDHILTELNEKRTVQIFDCPVCNTHLRLEFVWGTNRRPSQTVTNCWWY